MTVPTEEEHRTQRERARMGWAEALDGHPFVNVDDLFAELDRGEAVWWRGERSDVFVRIDRGVCEMGPVAGELDEMLGKALPEIEEWARQNGCTEMHVQAGREGWERALAPHGYECAAVILRKRLGDGTEF